MSEKGWKELPIRGLILEAGNSVNYNTGTWRSLRPIIDFDKCTHCMLCWVFCPDSSIRVTNSQVVGIDLRYCKGCGICAIECPRHAIVIVEEAQAGGEIQCVVPK